MSQSDSYSCMGGLVSHQPVHSLSLIRCRCRTTRDELSHRVFLMLQQCNKFREHQARELLIELLEKQLTRRKGLLHELETTVAQANAILEPTFPQPAV